MPEKRIYLASSALASENFDANRTIDESVKHGFYGVQLYINPTYHHQSYLDRLASRLNSCKQALVVHLPNLPDQDDLNAARNLHSQVKDASVLVHFLPLDRLPHIKGALVGWENSIIGPDIVHVEATKNRVTLDDTFFVFDFGRLMYTDSDIIRQQVSQYLLSEIPRLRPDKDIIHITDKTHWELRFRDCACALGQGIVTEFLPQVASFADLGGELSLSTRICKWP